MKKIALAWIVLGIGLVGAIGFLAGRQSQQPASSVPPNSPPPDIEVTRDAHPATGLVTPEPETPSWQAAAPPPESAVSGPGVSAGPAGPVQPASPTKPTTAPAFTVAVETLVNPQVSFSEKQGTWEELKNRGKLDQVITEFEQRVAANPSAPECPSVLGQAYLLKASTIQDMSEMGILGMKADQAFSAALKLDPNNWEARFWKASAMSYWPAELNRGQEVVDHLLTLVTQQETLPQAPHFAQTYLLLGNQYAKLGQADYAQAVWRRGAAYFPDDAQLREKLAAQP